MTFAAFGVVAVTSVSSSARCVSMVASCACMSPIFVGRLESVRIGADAGAGVGFASIESRRVDRVIAAAESVVIGIRIVVPTDDIWA